MTNELYSSFISLSCMHGDEFYIKLHRSQAAIDYRAQLFSLCCGLDKN